MENRPNADQIEYWNEAAGERWARLYPRIDSVFNPLTQAALENAGAQEGESILDIGCGCGSTTLELASHAGARGRVIGVDVSKPMLAVAAKRARAQSAADVQWVLADAAYHTFEPASADLIFSRFGVMFFDDPGGAFANMRKALEPGGRISFMCWRTAAEVPFFSVPKAVAEQHVEAEASDPEAPGPLSLGDQQRVRRILETAGYSDIRLRPFDTMLTLGRRREDAVDFLMTIGPISRLIAEADEATCDRIRASLDVKLREHETPGGVELGAGVWLVDARSDAAAAS